MHSNLSQSTTNAIIDYPSSDSTRPFAEYIDQCSAMIARRRTDLLKTRIDPDIIIKANSPYELLPPTASKHAKYKRGALLIHGLFDCPFSLRDVGLHLQNKGIFCRSILLPGHGTVPEDLLSVKYEDWLETVRYGVESMLDRVEQLFLVGYSTGAALSIYHALQEKRIAGILLLAPAIKIKAPVTTIFGWHQLLKHVRKKQWVYREDEIDYTKYLSIPFNPVNQLHALDKEIEIQNNRTPLACPVFMVTSLEDETISSAAAIKFFSHLANPHSKMLVYSAKTHQYADSRITSRLTPFPALNIEHLSHVSIPFSPDNFHYGQHGDYAYAAHIDSKDCIYGAYNRLEENVCDVLYKLGVLKKQRRQLTYNPDFDFMVEQISDFIESI